MTLETLATTFRGTDWHPALDEDNFKPRVELGGGSVKVWRCSAASGPEQLAVIGGTALSFVLKRPRSWIMQQNVDLKHQHVHLRTVPKDKVKVYLEWPSPGLDLNPTEMLWCDLERAGGVIGLANVAELKPFCREERTKLPPQRRQ